MRLEKKTKKMHLRYKGTTDTYLLILLIVVVVVDTFNIAAKRFNMVISPEKTKCMTISKAPKTCKLKLDTRMMDKIMIFNYLGIEVTSSRHMTKEVITQANKAATVRGCFTKGQTKKYNQTRTMWYIEH